MNSRFYYNLKILSLVVLFISQEILDVLMCIVLGSPI